MCRFGHPFEIPLLLQSILTVLAMMVLMELCVRLAPHTQIKHKFQGKEHKSVACAQISFLFRKESLCSRHQHPFKTETNAITVMKADTGDSSNFYYRSLRPRNKKHVFECWTNTKNFFCKLWRRLKTNQSWWSVQRVGMPVSDFWVVHGPFYFGCLVDCSKGKPTLTLIFELARICGSHTLAPLAQMTVNICTCVVVLTKFL